MNPLKKPREPSQQGPEGAEGSSPRGSEPSAGKARWRRLALRPHWVQAKLRVGASDDSLEREADRVADAALDPAASPVGGAPYGVQRKCEACEQGAGTCPACEEDEGVVQAKHASSRDSPRSVSSRLAQRIESLKGRGRPLPEPLRSELEPRLGLELSEVRVHTGREAARLADSLGARAFTRGSDVAFAAGEYTPETRKGRRLLTHELAHVGQQKLGRGSSARVGVLQREPDRPSERYRELSRVLTAEGRGAFFERLRQEGPFSDLDLWHFIQRNLRGDDEWLAVNLMHHGREENWPIHLQVELAMKSWGGGKGRVFDILRAANGAEAGNSTLRTTIDSLFAQGTDDRWLARTIQEQGPEPLWPSDLISERFRRANDPASPWAREPGNIGGTMTMGGRSVRAYFFPGRSDERALIIGGMHGSELEGVEVAEMLRQSLQTAARPPHFTTIIIPELFAENVARRRVREASGQSYGRNYARYSPAPCAPGQFGGHCVDPNRQYPELGHGLDPAHVDAEGRAQEAETVMLLQLIQRFRPTRIANLHSIHQRASAGIFADPRTNVAGVMDDPHSDLFDQDWELALRMARVVESRRSGSVAQNQPGTPGETAMYGGAARPARGSTPTKPSTRQGVSLGDWGSQDVEHPNLPSGDPDPRNRPSMTVLTIEISQQIPGTAAERQTELEGFRDALQQQFLEPNP